MYRQLPYPCVQSGCSQVTGSVGNLASSSSPASSSAQHDHYWSGQHVLLTTVYGQCWPAPSFPKRADQHHHQHRPIVRNEQSSTGNNHNTNHNNNKKPGAEVTVLAINGNKQIVDGTTCNKTKLNNLTASEFRRLSEQLNDASQVVTRTCAKNSTRRRDHQITRYRRQFAACLQAFADKRWLPYSKDNGPGESVLVDLSRCRPASTGSTSRRFSRAHVTSSSTSSGEARSPGQSYACNPSQACHPTATHCTRTPVLGGSTRSHAPRHLQNDHQDGEVAPSEAELYGQQGFKGCQEYAEFEDEEQHCQQGESRQWNQDNVEYNKYRKDHSIKRAGNFERSFDCLTPILIKEMTLRESKDMHKRRGNPLTSRPCSVDNYTPSQPSPPTGGVLDDRSDNIDQNPGVGGCSTPRHGLLSPVDRGNAGSYRGGGEGVGGDDVERLIASGFDQGRDQLTSSSSASCGLLQDENDDDSDDENIPEPRVPDLAEVAKVITTPRMMLRPDADGDFGYEVGGYSTTDEPLDDTPPTSAGHAPRLHRQRGGESRGRAGGGTTEGGSSCGEAMRGESGQIIQDQEEGEGGTAAIEGRVKSSSEIDVPYVDPMRFGETEFNPTRCDAYDLNWRSTIKASNLSSIECSWLDKVQRLARLERMTRQDETTFRCRAKTNRPATSFSVRRKNKNDQTTGDSTSETLPSFSPTTTTTTTTPTSNRLTSNRSSGCLSPRPSAPPPPPQPSVMSHSHPRTTSASGETVSPPRSLQPAKPCLSDCLQTACIGDCTGRRATIPTPVPMLTAPPRGGSATAVNGACGAVGVDKTSPSLATPPSFAIATPPVLPSGTAFPVTCPPESYDLYKRGSVTIVYTKQRPQSSLATSRRAARRLQQQQHVLQTEQVKSRPQSSATSTRTLATRTTVSSTKSSSNSTSGPRCSSGKKRRPKTAKS